MTNINLQADIGDAHSPRAKLFPAICEDSHIDWETNGFQVSEPQLQTSSGSHSKALNLTNLFRRCSVINVQGQVDGLTPAQGGGIRCTLRLSIGSITVHVSRDVLPNGINNGSWVRVMLYLARSAERDGRLLNVVTMYPSKEDATTSWLPSAAYVRNDHMRRLRSLLSGLEPGMQAIFMGAMSDIRVQQGFLRRVSAVDHHGYPGGLFDHSVEAAEIAWAQDHLTVRERGIAALSCLLFDLGKTADEWLLPDAQRMLDGLRPHPLSQALLKQPLAAVERMDADLVKQVGTLMQGFAWNDMWAASGAAPTLKQCVCTSILKSWMLNRHIGVHAKKGLV